MDLRLAGKSVVVTGGASNIGRAITLGFSAECADITVAEIDLEQGEAVAEQTRTTGARSATVMQCDVTDLDQVQALFDAATANHGGVDVLVNNVGWDGLCSSLGHAGFVAEDHPNQLRWGSQLHARGTRYHDTEQGWQHRFY